MGLLGPKSSIKVGAWNVRTMYEASKLAQVTREMSRYRLDILGISECRWTGTGRITTSDGSLMLYSGHDQHTRGVALIVAKNKTHTLLEWEPISERMIRARFNSKYCKLTILQCYAPTNEVEDEAKDEWYEQLQQVISKVPAHDMLLIIGDLNAKVGADNTNYARAMGQHGTGEMNDNGERLAEFCMNQNYVIGGTIFPHKNIHKLTWKSPDGKTLNQIDHIIINGKWRRSLEDVRVYRGADANSDHYLVSADIKLKLRSAPRQRKSRKQLDVNKLKNPEISKAFVLELRNRFDVLTADVEDPNRNWNAVKEGYVDTAKSILGFKGKKKNKVWLSTKTWDIINERGTLKRKMLSTKSPRLMEQVEQQYKTKDKEVKRSARTDKRRFVEELAQEAEKAAIKGELSTVYKITKQICGGNTCPPVPTKDKCGNVITNEREVAERWVEHFRDVLNQPEPDIAVAIEESQEDPDIVTTPPTEEEIQAAIKAMKNGKAAGIDGIHAEMLKADITTATKALGKLFNCIWEKEDIPEDWSKGLIVKLPKKGDLQQCDNWRGITLLSIPSKVFCKILLGRIQTAIDRKLRSEQAGFRKGKGCIDQIFALRNIIEQCLEWNYPLYINFIDFRKAFDSVHRNSLWKILESYGVPRKMAQLIKVFYEKFECSVIVDGSLSDWFAVNSGVRQGCILSPILFLVVIDWIMRNTTSDKQRGIQWTLFTQLEDLDFADDLACLSTNLNHLQEKTNRLQGFAQKTGLNTNHKKTQVMRLNTNITTPLYIDNHQLEDVDDFTYLGSVVSKDNGAGKDIKARLGKARGTFARLQSVWKSSQYSLKTKMKIYNSNVKSVLLYGSELWRVIKTETKKIQVFHNGCLRKICKIFWPRKITNADLYKKTNSCCIATEIKRRRLKWLGHVFRMDQNITKTALRWTPPGKRKPGRPKTTWQKQNLRKPTSLGEKHNM